ncbi:MAG: hypothetical protein A2068_13275 [Ignavibacteria bacterium GWB2_35_6b]|nr:MAG: hypothetical protein A2068_13275 [Ignavibacteria bacterium GWB2_35_6b]
MNPVINKILNNILLLSGGKFINLLKIEENQNSVLGFNGDFVQEKDLLESFNKELASVKEFEENEIRKLKSFKKILKTDWVKNYYFAEIKNADRVKIILNLFSQNELTNGTIEKIKPFESLIETLLDSENYIYESEISKLQLAILVTDKNGEKISSNKFFDTHFNINNEKPLRESLTIYNMENEKLEFENYPFNIVAVKKENQVEQRIKLLVDENIYKTYKVNSIVSIDDNGEVEKVINSFWDITDLAEAEEVVKETTKNIESILYSTGPDASNFYFISDAVKKMFGYSPEEIYSKRVSFLRKIYPQYLKNVREFIDNLREGKRSFVEYKFIDSEGIERMVRHTGVPIIKDGDVVRIVGVIYDITDERRIVEELEKSEEKFRILIETANDLIFSLDSYGYFKMVNKSGALSLGYSSEDMLGKHFLEFIDEDNKSEIAVAFQNILSSEEITNFEAAFIDKFGSKLIFDIQARPTKKDEVITGMIAIGRDITERRKDETKLKDLNAKLIEANRINQIERDRAKHQISVLEELNKLKNEFISNVSHELRTPLASIVGFAETMSSDEDLPRDAIKEFNSIILTEGKRLAKFINEVLDFSKLETDKNALDISKFDIIPVLLDLYESHKEQAAEKELTLSKEIPEAEIILNGDRTRIANSIARLLSNSIKFTNKGGRVTIIVQDFLKEVEIIVSDTGVGIAEKEIPNLFQKFKKVSRPGTQLPGAGFGLVTVKQIVDLHRGLIQVKSEVNKGTAFIIRLPKNN